MAFSLQDLNNQLKKMSDEIAERECALQQQYQETLDQTKRKLQTHEVTIQRLTSTLSDKEQQLQVTHQIYVIWQNLNTILCVCIFTI